MLHHVVMFSVRGGEDRDAVLAGLKLLERIPTRWPVQVTTNLRVDQLDNAIEFVVFGRFEDEAELERYKAHPLYEASISEVRPRRELRVAADFRLEAGAADVAPRTRYASADDRSSTGSQTMHFSLDSHHPDIAPTAWVAPGAIVLGQVKLDDRVGVWFNAVLRGDNDRIEIGEGSNIQDGAVLHVDPGYPIRIGRHVTIGHAAVVHGCTLGDGCLIGMNAVVLNGARIGAGCLIGANALVTEGTEVPDGSLVLGSPAKVVRQLDESARQDILDGAEAYVRKIERYRHGLVAH